MSRRRLVLEEMGLAPIWRLRASNPAAMAAETSADPVATSPADAASAARSALPAPADPTLPPQSPLPTPLSGSVRQPPAPIAQPDREDRRQQILGMDWNALKASVAHCVACPLNARRTNTVFGVGDEQAQWLFVGEGPGAEEDAKGEPFVGQAGRLLDNMLLAIDLQRGNNVYIANVVKCRPPSNRNPEPREMSCCEPYLSRQIALIKPKLIVALGKTAAGHLLQTDASIASLRGRVHAFQGIPLIVTYHPAYLLRTLQDKAKSWVDLCFARETMADLRAQATAG